MLNIPEYKEYAGETKIALMDNSSLAFMHELSQRSYPSDRILGVYDLILIPKWVMEEIEDSTYRSTYVEQLQAQGYPIRWIDETKYGTFVKEKRQKENLLTQIVVTLLTITLSSVTNAIGDGTNEAIRRGVMVSSVCILILVSLVFGHYIKKHLEKADDEFQISKNLREALNYYANNLYKENPLTII